MTTLPYGMTYRRNANGVATAVRMYVDLGAPEGEQVATTVATLATTESTRTGEPVSAQSVLRRAVRRGLVSITKENE